MEVDGGDLDDDAIEREWYMLTVLTSVPIKDEEDGKSLLKEAISNCMKSYLERDKDICKHFVTKRNLETYAVIEESVQKCLSKCELSFIKAEIRSGKSDGLSKDEVLKLKDEINEILKEVPSMALNFMVKSWHCFRLEQSSYWVSLGGDKFLVDSSILSDVIHPDTNI